MRGVLLAATLSTLAVLSAAQRPKQKDITGQALIDLADVGESCADSYTGYAIVDGSLEKCENLTSLQMGGGGGKGMKAYEEYKCKHLRVHGEMKSGKCVCKGKYKGPTCNDYDGCPADKPSLHASSCSKTGCANDGIMAIGKDHMECICKGEWDGKFCDRLACWRLTDRGHDKRYKNAGTKCECGAHYKGEDCSTLKSCEKNGKFENGVCVCTEGFGGETCGQKCPSGQVTCSTGSIFSVILALPVMAAVFNRLF